MNMHMNMYLWQNITWLFFHKLALNMNQNKKIHYENFFESFKILIPCSICRNHYIQMLDEPQFNLKKSILKNEIFNFTINIHNNVNLKTGKIIWTHGKAKKHYSSFFLDFYQIKRFLLIFVFHNFKKGPQKTQNLFKMILSFSHIFPRHNISQKLIKYQTIIKPNKNNFHKWITGYILIIKKELLD